MTEVQWCPLLSHWDPHSAKVINSKMATLSMFGTSSAANLWQCPTAINWMIGLGWHTPKGHKSISGLRTTALGKFGGTDLWLAMLTILCGHISRSGPPRGILLGSEFLLGPFPKGGQTNRAKQRLGSLGKSPHYPSTALNSISALRSLLSQD